MSTRSLLNMLIRLESSNRPRKRKRPKKQRRTEERKQESSQEHQA